MVHIVGDDQARAEASFIPKLLYPSDSLLYRDRTHHHLKSLSIFAASPAISVQLTTILSGDVRE
jgi:hypothetical protein